MLVGGSGAHDRDGEQAALPGYHPLRWLADHLSRHGVAVLRYDERGVGASDGDRATATSADFADDTQAAFEALRAFERIDTARFGLLGHSEGGVIAAMVVAR